MKQLSGTPRNISTGFIGKITKSNNLLSKKKDLIFVANDSKFSSNYLAIITSSSQIKDSIRSVCNVPNVSELNDNDIVFIQPDGTITVLYDANSIHNAIFVTEKCNSNCIMCPQPPVKHEEDKFNNNLRLISLFDKNTKSIGITGGEPTLLGDKLFDILDAIHNKTPKASISILSNGIKFEDFDYTKRFAQAIKQDLVIDIPLFSDIDSIHNSIVRINSFYRTINGIYNLAKFNIKIGIRIVIHKMNYNRLEEFSEFIYSNFPFVYHVMFMQMEPVGYAKDNINKLWIDPLEYNSQLEKAVLNLYHRDMHVSIYNAQLCILPSTLMKFAVQSISDWKNIYIDVCNNCDIKINCPGFFASSKNIHSRGINPIKNIQAKLA